MNIEEALEYANEWTKGSTFNEHSTGWRIVCAVLAAEVRHLRKSTVAAQRILSGLNQDNLLQYSGLPTEECKRLLSIVNEVKV